MKNTSLLRSIPYWLLLALSLVAALVGGWLVWDNTTTMTTTLLDGTATNIEVYVGQAWITAGAAILAAGIVGLLLALVLGAAKAFVPAAEPVVVEQIDWTTRDDGNADPSTGSGIDSTTSAAPEQDPSTNESEDQNGSSGSTATATKINVR